MSAEGRTAANTYLGVQIPRQCIANRGGTRGVLIGSLLSALQQQLGEPDREDAFANTILGLCEGVLQPSTYVATAQAPNFGREIQSSYGFQLLAPPASSEIQLSIPEPDAIERGKEIAAIDLGHPDSAAKCRELEGYGSDPRFHFIIIIFKNTESYPLFG